MDDFWYDPVPGFEMPSSYVICQLCNGLGHTAIDCLSCYEPYDPVHTDPSFSVSDWLYPEQNESLDSNDCSSDVEEPLTDVDGSNYSPSFSTSNWYVDDLLDQLHCLRKLPSQSLSNYFSEAKSISYALDRAGYSISEIELIEFLVDGLDPLFNKFVKYYYFRKPQISLDFLFDYLIDEEKRCRKTSFSSSREAGPLSTTPESSLLQVPREPPLLVDSQLGLSTSAHSVAHAPVVCTGCPTPSPCLVLSASPEISPSKPSVHCSPADNFEIVYAASSLDYVPTSTGPTGHQSAEVFLFAPPLSMQVGSKSGPMAQSFVNLSSEARSATLGFSFARDKLMETTLVGHVHLVALPSSAVHDGSFSKGCINSSPFPFDLYVDYRSSKSKPPESPNYDDEYYTLYPPKEWGYKLWHDHLYMKLLFNVNWLRSLFPLGITFVSSLSWKLSGRSSNSSCISVPPLGLREGIGQRKWKWSGWSD